MICLHHNDLDGRCAGAIIRWLMGDHCLFWEMSYNSEIPWEHIGPATRVIIADFALQKPGDWERLMRTTKDVLWFDHHQSNINEKRLEFIPGVRDMNKCGARLVWDWFLPGRDIPEALLYIDLWDRWAHGNNDRILDFVAGMKLEDTEVRSSLWPDLLELEADLWENSGQLKSIIKRGTIIRRYEENENRKNVGAYAYPVHWTVNGNTYKLCVFHGVGGSSKFFDGVWGRYDLYAWITRTDKGYTVHLYSDPKVVKAYEIAQVFGGGGHPGAAGFQCKTLPWEEKSCLCR